MTKAELVKKIANDAVITGKAAGKALDAFVGVVQVSLKKKDGKIRIPDLGTFLVVYRKARNGVNPQTGKKIKIPAAYAPRFRASKALKQAASK